VTTKSGGKAGRKTGYQIFPISQAHPADQLLAVKVLLFWLLHRAFPAGDMTLLGARNNQFIRRNTGSHH